MWLLKQTALLIALVLLAGPGYAREPMIVFASIAPQTYFVNRIGGDQVDVRVMVPPGANPHTYEPRPAQMAALAKSKLYFAVGIEFEAARLGTLVAVNPGLQVIHTDQGIEKRPMPSFRQLGVQSGEQETKVAHGHDEHAQEHEHLGLDPHIWLAPLLVKIQAQTIRDALVSMDPPNRAFYQANATAFMAELDDLDAELRSVFADRQGQAFMVFHPSWGYFAHAYGLRQIPVEIQGSSPKLAQTMSLITYARQNDIKVIFTQPQFSAKSANMIAREIGGRVVSVDPMAVNWPANLRQVAQVFKSALKKP